ncbi:hypothetical protein BH11PSE8_BH11PSE8_34030 [soil metagenome]
MFPRTPRKSLALLLAVVIIVMIASFSPTEWYQPMRHFLRQLWRVLS